MNFSSPKARVFSQHSHTSTAHSSKGEKVDVKMEMTCQYNLPCKSCRFDRFLQGFFLHCTFPLMLMDLGWHGRGLQEDNCVQSVLPWRCLENTPGCFQSMVGR